MPESKVLLKRGMEQKLEYDSLLLTLLSLGVLAYCSLPLFTLLAFRQRLNIHLIVSEACPVHCTVSKTMREEG